MRLVVCVCWNTRFKMNLYSIQMINILVVILRLEHAVPTEFYFRKFIEHESCKCMGKSSSRQSRTAENNILYITKCPQNIPWRLLVYFFVWHIPIIPIYPLWVRGGPLGLGTHVSNFVFSTALSLCVACSHTCFLLFLGKGVGLGFSLCFWASWPLDRGGCPEFFGGLALS